MAKIPRARRALTLLDDPALDEPLTPAARESLLASARSASQENLKRLLDFARMDDPFAESLCKQVTDAFGSSDKLGPLMIKRLRVDRRDKRKAPRTWTHARYNHLLTLYEICRFHRGRPDALRRCAEIFKLPEAKIEARITKARKRLSTAEKQQILETIPPPK